MLFQTCLNFLLLLNTKEEALYLFSILWKSMAASNILHNILYSAEEGNQTGLKQLEGE